MNRQLATQGVVLRRTDFGEADRIITFLTPDHGKVRTMAKGVRRSKAKLAGSVELFGVSDISFIPGRGELNALTSARLQEYFGNIIKDAGRTQAGFDVISLVNKATEDNPGREYFELLTVTLAGLDDQSVPPELTLLWFRVQLLKLAGHAPDLRQDTAGAPLDPESTYDFDVDAMRFARPANGRTGQYGANHIKFLRLALAAAQPAPLAKITNAVGLISELQPLPLDMLRQYIRV